jgi:hypothetical protein
MAAVHSAPATALPAAGTARELVSTRCTVLRSRAEAVKPMLQLVRALAAPAKRMAPYALASLAVGALSPARCCYAAGVVPPIG